MAKELEFALKYLWEYYMLDILGPAPEEWFSYSLEQIIEWCKADELEWKSWHLRMDKIENEFPTCGIEEEA